MKVTDINALSPSKKRLILEYMTTLALKDGKGIADVAMLLLTQPGIIGKHALEAKTWLDESLAKLMACKDCPFKDDEEAAVHLVRLVDERLARIKQGQEP